MHRGFCSLGWAYVPDWTRYELPFRTGEKQTSIRLRPWMYFQGDDGGGKRLSLLYTLESALKAARHAGRGRHPAVTAAQAFLDDLRKQVPLNTYAVRPQGAAIAVWNPVPDIAPAAYDTRREECARHIISLRGAMGRR